MKMAVKKKPQVVGEKYIDASGCVAGRLASYVAKLALSGYRVYIVNSEKAIITGNPKMIKKEWWHKWYRSDWYKGPFYPRTPDRMLKRIIRGMLPRKKWRGRVAYSRIRCYIGIPEELKDKEFETIEEAKPRFERGVIRYMTLGDLAKFLGAKVEAIEAK